MDSVILWNLQENDMADLFLGGRKIVFPCDFSDITTCYDGSTSEVNTNELETVETPDSGDGGTVFEPGDASVSKINASVKK